MTIQTVHNYCVLIGAKRSPEEQRPSVWLKKKDNAACQALASDAVSRG